MSDLPPTNRQTLVLRLFDGEEMGLCRQALLVGLVAGHMLKHSFWQKEGSRMPFELRSSRFRENGAIAKKYTCDGPDVSVPLNWTDPPDGTKSFALVVDDPDAPSGTFVHWVLYDLPGDARQLAENIPPKRVLDNGAKQGVNDFHKIGYGGPCPPRGPAHRYVFTLYALNRVTGLQPGVTKEQLLSAIEGHTSAETQLTGIYRR